ncbi:hypothetical protein C1E24_01585 [Pseudoalteromonas phenolica]|uniref:Uncharacterized protein n=1 Tax=Pseudoalteromonas phenolica TaxID=161398 RepID=A0A5R9Q7N6_9GAMM|nr:hypothetical protein [Pseudoalteromonas phenolica]TLX48824.1 hypothetical protein C1E24_01585 [Pseudoalteromonas phenolica]
MLNYFEEKTDEKPDWVSDQNCSHKIYQAFLTLKEEKREYISRHRLKGDFKKKKSYTFSMREASKKAGIKHTNVTSLRRFDDIKVFFEELNLQLTKEKEERVKKFQGRSRGKYESSKSELIEEIVKVKEEYRGLEKKDAEAQINVLISKMKPDVKRLLFS